jgi:hypothetical protein
LYGFLHEKSLRNNLPSDLLPSGFCTKKNYVPLLYTPYAISLAHQSSSFDHPKIFGEGYRE